jgi:hypothetical protein
MSTRPQHHAIFMKGIEGSRLKLNISVEQFEKLCVVVSCARDGRAYSDSQLGSLVRANLDELAGIADAYGKIPPAGSLPKLNLVESPIKRDKEQCRGD